MYFLPSATKLRRLCFYRHLSVDGGGDVCLSACWDNNPPKQTPPWSSHPPGAAMNRSRHPPGADTPPLGADPPWEQTPSPGGADTPSPGADTPWSSHPTGSRDPVPPPRYGHCCGRYASYWNAFLLNFVVLCK